MYNLKYNNYIIKYFVFFIGIIFFIENKLKIGLSYGSSRSGNLPLEKLTEKITTNTIQLNISPEFFTKLKRNPKPKQKTQYEG